MEGSAAVGEVWQEGVRGVKGFKICSAKKDVNFL